MNQGPKNNIETFKEEIDTFFAELTTISTVFEAQVETMLLCAGKPIENEIAYNILTFSLEGLVLKITRLNEELLNFFNRIKSTNPQIFGSNTYNKYLRDTKSKDKYLYHLLRPGFNDARLRLFPLSDKWQNGRPSFNDFKLLQEKILKASSEIKAYRDTEIAHNDKKLDFSLEVTTVKNYFTEMEQIFTDLYLIAFLSTRKFTFGGMAISPKETATKLALICTEK